MREKKQDEGRGTGEAAGAATIPGSWLLAAWILGIAYLVTARGFGPATVEAAWPVLSIARWGAWLLPLGAWFIVAVERKRGLIEIAPVSASDLGRAAGYALAAHFALLIPGHGAATLVPTFLVQFTAVAAFLRARGERERRPFWPVSGEQWRISLTHGCGAAVALLSVLSLFVVAVRLAVPGFAASLSLTASGVAWNRDLWEVALKILCIPFCEEILFRAGVIGWLKPRLGATVAVLLSAVLFSALHGQFEIFWARLAGGLFMGWLYIRCGHVGPSFVLHAIANAGLFFGPLAAKSLGWA